MTYKERYGTVENKIKEESQHWLEDIEKEGYLYYSEAYNKHIDLYEQNGIKCKTKSVNTY